MSRLFFLRLIAGFINSGIGFIVDSFNCFVVDSFRFNGFNNRCFSFWCFGFSVVWLFDVNWIGLCLLLTLARFSC